MGKITSGRVDAELTLNLKTPALAAELAAWEFTAENFEALPFRVVTPDYIATIQTLNGYFPLADYPDDCWPLPSEVGCSALFRYVYAKIDIFEHAENGVIRARAKFGRQKVWGTAPCEFAGDIYGPLREATRDALQRLNLS